MRIIDEDDSLPSIKESSKQKEWRIQLLKEAPKGSEIFYKGACREIFNKSFKKLSGDDKSMDVVCNGNIRRFSYNVLSCEAVETTMNVLAKFNNRDRSGPF